MRDYKSLSLIFIVAISFFFLLEAFFNILVDINAYIFMNFSNFLSIIPSLIILICIIVLEFLFFTLRKIQRLYRAYLLIYIISGLRIATQFIIIPSIIFILNFLMLFSLLILFVGFILLFESYKEYMSASKILATIIIGLGIQFIFLIVDTSSNLTSNYNKIISTFLFTGLLIIFNNLMFYPGSKKSYHVIEKQPNSGKEEISLFQFLILGILFLYSMMWIFNPMALSAYDPINLIINGLDSTTILFWPTFGFTYYILIIFLTAIVSYVITLKYLLSLQQKTIKLIGGFLGLMTSILTIFAGILIENNTTVFSTFYLSTSVVFGVFFIVFYVSYLFNFFYFKQPRKLILGIFLFFIIIFFFIILHIEILWKMYLSLLTHVSIQIVSAVILIFLYEIRFLKRKLMPKERIIGLTKPITISLISILLIFGITITISAQTRVICPSQNEKLNLMVWNIHNAIGDDDVFQLDRIVNQIKQNNPDILGLNEVDLGALKTSFIDLPSYFGYKLNMYYFYGYTYYKHYGNVLLSKYPILEAEIISLPLTIQSAEPRSLIRAKIQINSSVWTIFLTHLSTESEDRLVQVPFIVNRINQESTFEKMVWMGDFNFEPSSSAYLLINSTSTLNFTDSYRFLNSDNGFTSHFDNNHIPQKRIDYIILSPDIIPIKSEVFCSIASDHCAVITQI